MTKRISSGIAGLDAITCGGFPEKSMILVSGHCGAGKTILGLQFICNSDDRGIFVSFEEGLDKIRDTARQFGWEIEKMEREGKIRLLKYDPYRFEDIFDIIENNIREIDARRIVIDSISALGVYVHDVPELRRIVLQAGLLMKKYSCTALLLSEIARHGEVSRFGVEEFVCDGVVILENTMRNEEYRRTMHIMKMRFTDHSKKAHVYEIGRNGINVKWTE